MNSVPDQTPEEILAEASTVAARVHTYRLDQTSETTTFTRGAEVHENYQIQRIQVGSDSYENEIAGDGSVYESLTYNGILYNRSEEGNWRPSVGGVIAVLRTGQEAASLEFYGQAVPPSSTFTLLDAEISEGTRLFHLRAETRHELPPIPSASKDLLNQFLEFAKAPQLTDQLQDMNLPDSIEERFDLWVGQQDSLVYRINGEASYYRAGSLVGKVSTTLEISAFNEPLDLPGPLPVS